ncbi:hypothetical protein REPUB_Repub02eG0108200 [Reevesia pubescens]
MGKVKNVICYDELAEILEHLRLDGLMKKKCGMLESFRPTYGSNSNEIIMEEDTNDSDIDSDYEKFLSDLEPDYDIFLENLEKDEIGESFLVKLPSSSGASEILRFEEEAEGSFQNVETKRNLNSDSKRLKAKLPENSGGFLRKSKTKMPKTVKKFSKIGAEGSKNKVRDVSSKESKSQVDENDSKEAAEADFVPCKSSGESSEKMNSDMIDENFEVILDSMNKQGESLEIILESYPTSIHRKDDESFLRKSKTKMPKTVKKFSKIGAEGSKNKVRDVSSKESKSQVDENDSKEAAEADFVPCKSSGESSEKMNSDMIDENFEVILDSMNKQGESLEIILESYPTSIHRKDDESCSDLEIHAWDNIPFHEGGYTPFVPSKCYQSLTGEESWDAIRTSSQSQFREKLMDLLKIPYDRNEFENLWREVTYRKPVQGFTELRHGVMKPYSTKTDGKSYLDWYKGVIDVKYYISYVDFSFGWRILLMKVHFSLGWTRCI